MMCTMISTGYRRHNYPIHLCIILGSGLLCMAAGCGGSRSSTANKSDKTSAVPRVPTPVRGGPINEPEPESRPPVSTPPSHPIGPWLEWQLTQSATVTGKAYLKLIVVPDSDSVLQLTSYDTDSHEEFPSLFLRALTPARSLAELAGQRLPAQLTIQIASEGNMLHNLPNQPMEIVLTEMDGPNVRGTFAGQAHDVESTGNGPISGKFQAVMESPVVPAP